MYAASNYFKTMFTADMKEKDAKEIVLQDLEGETLGQLIHYCYTLKISIDDDKVDVILAAAHFYELTQLVTKCQQFYQNNLSASNALSYLTIAETYDLTDFHGIAERFVFRNFMKISEDSSFFEMAADNLAQLLSRSEISVNMEEDVFNAAVKWIEADRNERKQHFPMLMDAVRLSQINKKVC